MSISEMLLVPFLLASFNGNKIFDLAGDLATSAVSKLLTTANSSHLLAMPPVNERQVRVKVGTEEDAKYYFSYAVLSYCNSSVIREWKCRSCQKMGSDWKVQDVVKDMILETQGVVAVNHKRKEIGIVFRGSNGLNNQIQNSLFQQVPLEKLNPAIKVHFGFSNIASGLQTQVLAAVKILREQRSVRDYSITMTGHSMGGAVAAIMAINIQREFNIPWDRFSIYTYGQPRTGNLEFANYYNSLPLKITRTVNENDVVPHVPANFQGYFHTLTELYIQNNKARVCLSRLVEDDTCSKSRVSDLNKDSHDIAWDMSLGEGNCQPYTTPYS
ncbi:hypothetical protein DSO57_1006935 [Entomophthora muscae]|uniref:Uncharacterized protein n=1 Tax=Entomophthora muscae TaxID=34485 RepID=A0ACC2SWF2_9FUNG|nr:hypothetical protein DSO57_1006935 [Entomophthora muscae]